MKLERFNWTVKARIATFWPALFSLGVLCMVIIMHIMAYHAGHLDIMVDGKRISFVTPPISFTGNHWPEYGIYAFGSLTAVYAAVVYANSIRGAIEDGLAVLYSKFNEEPGSPPHAHEWVVTRHEMMISRQDVQRSPTILQKPLLLLSYIFMHIALAAFIVQAMCPAQTNSLQLLGSQCKEAINYKAGAPLLFPNQQYLPPNIDNPLLARVPPTHRPQQIEERDNRVPYVLDVLPSRDSNLQRRLLIMETTTESDTTALDGAISDITAEGQIIEHAPPDLLVRDRERGTAPREIEDHISPNSRRPIKLEDRIDEADRPEFGFTLPQEIDDEVELVGRPPSRSEDASEAVRRYPSQIEDRVPAVGRLADKIDDRDDPTWRHSNQIEDVISPASRPPLQIEDGVNLGGRRQIEDRVHPVSQSPVQIEDKIESGRRQIEDLVNPVSHPPFQIEDRVDSGRNGRSQIEDRVHPVSRPPVQIEDRIESGRRQIEDLVSPVSRPPVQIEDRVDSGRNGRSQIEDRIHPVSRPPLQIEDRIESGRRQIEDLVSPVSRPPFQIEDRVDSGRNGRSQIEDRVQPVSRPPVQIEDRIESGRRQIEDLVNPVSRPPVQIEDRLNSGKHGPSRIEDLIDRVVRPPFRIEESNNSGRKHPRQTEDRIDHPPPMQIGDEMEPGSKGSEDLSEINDRLPPRQAEKQPLLEDRVEPIGRPLRPPNAEDDVPPILPWQDALVQLPYRELPYKELPSDGKEERHEMDDRYLPPKDDRKLQSDRLRAIINKLAILDPSRGIRYNPINIEVSPELVYCPEVTQIQATLPTLIHAGGAITFFSAMYISMNFLTLFLIVEYFRLMYRSNGRYLEGDASSPFVFKPSLTSILLKLLLAVIPLFRPLELIKNDILRHVSLIDYSGLNQRLAVSCVMLFVITLGLEIECVKTSFFNATN